MTSFPGFPPLLPTLRVGRGSARGRRDSHHSHLLRPRIQSPDRQTDSPNWAEYNKNEDMIILEPTEDPHKYICWYSRWHFTYFNSVINLSLSLWETTGVQVFYYCKCKHYIYIYLYKYIQRKRFFGGNIMGDFTDLSLRSVASTQWKRQALFSVLISLLARLCNRFLVVTTSSQLLPTARQYHDEESSLASTPNAKHSFSERVFKSSLVSGVETGGSPV